MTLDEVISYNRLFADMETKSGDLEVAEYYRDTAKCLEELKDLREQIAEYKRLLKAAMGDITGMQFGNECKVCSKKLLPECPIHNNKSCILERSFKWRYADEALSLIGGSENG